MDRLAWVLDRVERVASSGPAPVVVFDLDSTLIDTAPRNLAILGAFADAERARFPELSAHVAALSVDALGWEVLEPLRRRGYDPDGLAERFEAFWAPRFFSDAWLPHDVPHPGAVAFVAACHARGALVYYLTGRHVEGMALGTVASLRALGFPLLRGRTVLHLKPRWDLPDRAHKQQAVRDIRSHHAPVVATFENEPANANLFLASFPDALHFLLDTDHSPGAPPPDPALIRIPDFRGAGEERPE